MVGISATLAAALSASAMLLANAVYADSTSMAEGASNDSQLMEIVVTAQKGQESLQQVPGEVVAISAAWFEYHMRALFGSM